MKVTRIPRILLAHDNESNCFHDALADYDLLTLDMLQRSSYMLCDVDISLILIDASFNESRAIELLSCIRETPILMVRSVSASTQIF